MQVLLKAYLGAITLVGLAWILDAPQYFGISLIDAEWIGLLLGLGVAAAFLKHPYFARPGPLEAAIGMAALACWLWMAAHSAAWVVDASGNTPPKWIPGVVAIVLLMEAMRKTAGLAITILVWALVAYGLFGYVLPGPFEAEKLPASSLVMYLYADTNGVPGLVLTVIGTLVLAFMVLGRLMEATGATKFFTDLALAAMGHRRGGPAKVAVVASSVFGSINGSVIANIMSIGIVTIPLMKKSGFKAHIAGAVEAVASSGGQIAPPVMGAAAFLIAQFLEISYADVALAALVPAALYYVCLFLQVDSIAARHGLEGLPKHELPRAGPVLRAGWVFLLPFVVLLYLLFGRGFDAAPAALYATSTLLVLTVLAAVWKRAGRGEPQGQETDDSGRARPRLGPRLGPGLGPRLGSRLGWRLLSELLIDVGGDMLPLLMIGGGAGVVIGVMNITGLGFSLSLVLGEIGSNAGTFVMLFLTGVIAIVLGMGMPSTAIYVVLSVVLEPALVQMGVPDLAAHLFIFYFGLLSFLTPPVAVASYVAAGLAGSGMWSTSWEALKLGAVAYLLPFLWCYNPALILQGSPLAIVYAIVTAFVAALLVARASRVVTLRDPRRLAFGVALYSAALVVGASTILLGQESPAVLGAAAAGVALLIAMRRARLDEAIRLAKA
jgi:TRAP transporter 4TM/12TM fusion protein